MNQLSLTSDQIQKLRKRQSELTVEIAAARARADDASERVAELRDRARVAYGVDTPDELLALADSIEAEQATAIGAALRALAAL